jgi:4'-phosphopantetheinyl transferase
LLARLLDDDERSRAERFHFERDRQAYIAAHALVRTMLSTQHARRPEAWRFSTNAHGKPQIADENAPLPLRFNLSHTYGLVAVALTLSNEIGIDVEEIKPKRLSLDLAERTFAPAEVALLRAMPADRLPETLFAIWTLKEACIKAIGLGLAMPLDAFAVGLNPLTVSFAASLGESPAHWLLWRHTPTPAHTLALAMRHADPSSVRIDAAPLESAELIAAADYFHTGSGEISLR